jgi:two-component system phosphate regulon response regulator OmpR
MAAPTDRRVDDDARIRDLLRRYLTQEGFEVLLAEDAKALNRLLMRETVNLIVLDLMMPGEDGLSICRRLRAGNDVTPIIMLTAKVEDVDRIVGLEVGADDYLPKPFNPRELLARIHAVLRRRPTVEGARRTGARRQTDSIGLHVRSRLAVGLSTGRASRSPPHHDGEFSMLQGAGCDTRASPLSLRHKLAHARPASREFEPFDRSLDRPEIPAAPMIEPGPDADRGYIQTGLGESVTSLHPGRRRREASAPPAGWRQALPREASLARSRRRRDAEPSSAARSSAGGAPSPAASSPWVQTFRALEFEPRAVQAAQQIASLVNVARSALRSTDGINRVALLKSMAGVESVRLAPREPADQWQPYEEDRLSRAIGRELRSQLGQDTLVASSVNGAAGLWIGLSIDRDPYLAAGHHRGGRLRLLEHHRPLGRDRAARHHARLGADRPPHQPAAEGALVRGHPHRRGRVRLEPRRDHHDERDRQVNMGFNRMARELAKVEQDRAVMLAGISHDLRTPLARLRLEPR